MELPHRDWGFLGYDGGNGPMICSLLMDAGVVTLLARLPPRKQMPFHLSVRVEMAHTRRATLSDTYAP